MPIPLSRTASDQLVVIARHDRGDVPAGSVYFAAFVSKFATTCASRTGSALHQ